MKTIEHIEVCNADGEKVAFLSPESDGLKDCCVDSRLNGESKLEFLLPSTSEKVEELTPECQIWAGGRVYTLLQDDAIDTVMDDPGKLWTKFMAIEIWAELDTKYPEPYITNDPSTPTPADLAVIIVSGGLYSTGSAGHALYAILNGSDWSIGTVDVTGVHDLEAEKVSRLQLIKQVQETWGGYLVWDSENKTVSLRSESGWQNYTGFQLRYAKNLKNITRTQSNRLVTKLYAFGEDNLDISSVNNGVKYVTDFSYTAREYVGIYCNPDISDAQELKDKAVAELSLICRPRYNYKAKIVDLRTLPEYSHEDFSLGDMADILNSKLDIDDRVRIIRHKYNLFQPWKCELELGDPEERLVENLKASFNTAGFISNTFDSSGRMSGGKLVDLSITYKQLAAASVTTQAIASLAVDTSKLADLAVEAAKLANSSVVAEKIANAAVGSAAIAATAIGSAHIATAAILNLHVADGAITNAKIGALAVNTAKIADAAITNAKIANATITDAKIQSLSASKLTAGTIDASIINVTNLNASNITTGNLSGNRISGGTITGSLLKTASATNYLHLKEQYIDFYKDDLVKMKMGYYDVEGGVYPYIRLGAGYYNDSTLVDIAEIYKLSNRFTIRYVQPSGTYAKIDFKNTGMEIFSGGNDGIKLSTFGGGIHLSDDTYFYHAARFDENCNIGFFGVTPAIQQTATRLGDRLTMETADITYGTDEVAMLNHLKGDVAILYAKVNGMLDKLSYYGLFKLD